MTSGNDYVLQVKGIQSKLRATIEAQYRANPIPVANYTQLTGRCTPVR